MPFGSVSVWDELEFIQFANELIESPMPFGSVSVWDDANQYAGTQYVHEDVTNAFRQCVRVGH